MKIQTRTWRAALVLASCPLAASAQTAAPVITPAPSAPPAQTVTLRLKFTPGQTLYYRLTTDTAGLMLTGQSGAGIPIKNHMEMLLHQTVKDVRATDGAATVDSGIDTMTMSMNGQTFPIPEDKLAQMKIRRHNGDPADRQSAVFHAQCGARRPRHARNGHEPSQCGRAVWASCRMRRSRSAIPGKARSRRA